MTFTASWGQAQNPQPPVYIPVTPSFAGATYYKITTQSGPGGSTYTYSALTSNSKANDPLLVVWDILSDPVAAPAYRYGAGTLTYTRIKDGAGNVITPSTPPGPQEDSGYKTGRSVDVLIVNLGETKVIQANIVPKFAGTYRLTFGSTQSMNYQSTWNGTYSTYWYLAATTFVPSIEITVDP